MKQERETEVIPVQSLNLLLKSIGATLTDVQDVVFKWDCASIQNAVVYFLTLMIFSGIPGWPSFS